jgi:predicted N-acetyltransferase YhbS
MWVRGAHPDDYPAVRDILADAFPTDDEARLWDTLVAHDAALRPECVSLAVLDGRPVACAVALPRAVRGRTGWTPGAIVTLVACVPACRRRGYSGLAVRAALDYMTREGLALGVLYGHPAYYPRFGFVPVLPAWETALDLEALPQLAHAAPSPRIAIDEDVPTLAALYVAQAARHPCAVARPAEPWLWRSRERGGNRSEERVLILPARGAYAVVADDPAVGALVVREAGAADTSAWRRLFSALAREARDQVLGRLLLRLPPDHPLVRLALLRGASQTYRPAAAGMVAITRWDPLLPPDYRVTTAGICRGETLVLRADRRALTALVVGYRDVDDLLLAEDCALVGDEAEHEALRRDFPAALPCWSLAPFWNG